MGILSQEMKQIVEDVRLSFVATCSKEGKPNVSPKGSIRVLDDNSLVFAEVNSARTKKNLEENPKVALDVLNLKERKGFQFKGTAELINSGPIFDAAEEYNEKRGFPRPNVAIKINIEEVHLIPTPR